MSEYQKGRERGYELGKLTALETINDLSETIERLRAEIEKLRLELDMLQATVLVPSQKDDQLRIEHLNTALVAALDEAAKLRAELEATKSPPDYGTQKIMNEQIHYASLIAQKDRENERLRAENEKLRAALKPFAVMAMLDNMKEYEASPDECVMTAGIWGNKPLLTFRLGDLRAAAAALKETSNE